ncbi:GmrSD restriction endonuclease domain-containing protein [Sphingobacterium sp. HJSM2_6]|uniref:GmrSD restriction endonuclease domain-containing protein n=1 Tax=Sphingobacterium sp. HJSM2_6 TaxID=3366264 RepID=UPI003BDC8BC5
MIIKYSFHQLITKHIIEIPIIQRDYAQGRRANNVNYIRERFVKSLVDHIVEKEKLHLGFVYGKIEGKERLREAKLHQDSVRTLLHNVAQYANQFNIDVETKINVSDIDTTTSLIFKPLDGQQRLTTLFLLYWYIAMRKGETPKELQNFKYNNRKLALAFFEELTNKTNVEVCKSSAKSGHDILKT